MKLRVTLLSLSIMGMAGLVFLLLKPDGDALVEVPPPSPPRILPDPEPPPAPAPETAEQQANRLKELDPYLREAVIRIESAVRQWEKQNPDAAPDAWGEIVFGELNKLEAEQLSTLFDAALLRRIWLLSGYSDWVYVAWGAREPARARDWMLRSADHQGLLDGPGAWDSRYTNDWLQGIFQDVQIGHARRDPLAAWQQMAEDLDNPRMEFVTGKFFAEFILEFYAKQDPQAAWREIDSRRDLAFHLVPGFAMGAAAGQDWPARLEDYASLCRGANGDEAGSDRAVNSLMARWLAEDPDAALAWVDLHLRLHDFPSLGAWGGRKAPPQLPGVETPSEDLLVELEMMRDIYICFWSRHQLMTEILTSLIAKGHLDLAALSIADRLGSRWDRRLYPLILSFPDPALREALLLTAVRKLPEPEGDSTTREEADQHLAVIYSLWTLSAETEVSEEARNQAKTGLRRAYAAEQRAAARRKSR